MIYITYFINSGRAAEWGMKYIISKMTVRSFGTKAKWAVNILIPNKHRKKHVHQKNDCAILGARTKYLLHILTNIFKNKMTAMTAGS